MEGFGDFDQQQDQNDGGLKIGMPAEMWLDH